VWLRYPLHDTLTPLFSFILQFDAEGAQKVYDFFVKEMLINETTRVVGNSRL
jgi:hypothetical protein